MSIRVLVLAAFAVCVSWQGGTALGSDDVAGYSDYTNWQDWARLRVGMRTHLASSYDRSGANDDYSQYESPSGLLLDEVTSTVATVQGPGVVTRFWMPHLTAKRAFAVRMYFDGEATPRISTDSAALLGGSFGYFASPLVTTAAGGQVCYEPIPFAASLRIETVNKTLPASGWSANRHYYQYTYATLTPGAAVASYTGTLTAGEQAARSATVGVLTDVGQHPAGESSTALRVTTTAVAVPAGGCVTLGDIAGPGVIRRLTVRMGGAADAELEGLRLRVRYDGDPTAAIDVCLAHFFGAGRGRASYRSLLMGTDSQDGFYCFWPMPFRSSVLVEACNTTSLPIQIGGAVVEYEPGPQAREMCYLHATTRASVRVSGDLYHPILSVNGCGHYVGNLLYLKQAVENFGMLEGDEVIAVDGAYVMNGTGTEDAYNGGYYYNWVAAMADEPEGASPHSAIRPLHGILYVDRGGGVTRADQYRWQIADCVPFSRSIDVKIENRYAVAGAEYTSVAFWYQRPSVQADFDVDGDVDLTDFGLFEGCFNGPNRPPAAADCDLADLDWDGDVDLADFGLFQACFNGPNRPPGEG